jgi:hypothetical protein
VHPDRQGDGKWHQQHCALRRAHLASNGGMPLTDAREAQSPPKIASRSRNARKKDGIFHIVFLRPDDSIEYVLAASNKLPMPFDWSSDEHEVIGTGFADALFERLRRRLADAPHAERTAAPSFVIGGSRHGTADALPTVSGLPQRKRTAAIVHRSRPSRG